jgi:DinB family protein
LSTQIDQVHVLQNLFDILDEAFVTHHGIFLDEGTSLFETLETITAEEASIPVGGKCATLAAQVAHVNFYVEVLEAHILQKDIGKVDWGDIWRRVDKVSPEEWKAYQDQLKETYQRIISMLQRLDPVDWNDERPIGGALAIAVHTAYHLGEIRQAMCIVKQE